MSLSGSPGAPLDVLSTPYGYSGQFSPETAVAEQALNRKRLITNLLMQQGLQGAPAGQMVGRFYVPSSPLQGASHLIQAGLGAYLGSKLDDQQKELAQADNDAKNKVIQAYLDARKPKQVMDQVPQPPPAPPAMTPDQAQPEASLPTEPFRGIAPRPEGPYSGEVGAAAMPDVAIQSEKEPIPNGPYAGQYKFGVNPRGLSQDITPADMSQFANPSGPAPQAPSVQTPPAPPAQTAPMPAPQQTMRTVEQSPEDRYAQIVQLMTNSHPAVQRFGAMEFQRMMQEAEHARDQSNRNRGFDLQERGQNLTADNTRALREDTKAYREASLAQQKELTGATQAIAQQRADTDKAQAEAAAQQAKDRLAAELKIAKGHDATTLAAAQLRNEQKQVLSPQQQQKMRSDHAKDYQALSGIDEKNNLAIKRIDEILDPKKANSFNNLYGGYNAYATQHMPGETQDVKNNIEALKANLKMAGFELIRQGGSIGQMTEREWPIVADQIAKLDNPRISEPEARRTLEDVKNFLVSHKNKAREVYDMEWGDSPYYQKGKSSIAPSAPASGGSTLNALPQGAKQIGTSGGKPVYQTPDGKKFIGD